MVLTHRSRKLLSAALYLAAIAAFVWGVTSPVLNGRTLLAIILLSALFALAGAIWPRPDNADAPEFGCPGGCGCRLGTDDADARECGCDEGCCEVFSQKD